MHNELVQWCLVMQTCCKFVSLSGPTRPLDGPIRLFWFWSGFDHCKVFQLYRIGRARKEKLKSCEKKDKRVTASIK